jgi:hypothetical protein
MDASSTMPDSGKQRNPAKTGVNPDVDRQSKCAPMLSIFMGIILYQ